MLLNPVILNEILSFFPESFISTHRANILWWDWKQTWRSEESRGTTASDVCWSKENGH